MMTKKEALELARKGEKITHTLFAKDEWITLRGCKVETEEGYFIDQELFFQMRPDQVWQNGWSVFKPEEKESQKVEEFKYFNLDIRTGEFSNSFSLMGGDSDDDIRFAYRNHPYIKIIKFSCINDENFEFTKHMKLK